MPRKITKKSETTPEPNAPGRVYTPMDTHLHLEALEELMLRKLYNEQKCVRSMLDKVRKKQIPYISERRVRTLYYRLEKEWASMSKHRRQFHWEKKVRELEEFIEICRNGVVDEETGKTITRPTRMVEIQARVELHRILGMRSDTPVVQIANVVSNAQNINQQLEAIPPAALSQMLLGLPGLKSEAIEVRAEVANEKDK